VEQQLADGTLVSEVRRLIETAANERLGWIRANARAAMIDTRQDPVTISALTGIAVGTVKGFLEHRDTSIKNVVLIAVALGLSAGDLERPPAEFDALLRRRRRSQQRGHAGLRD
jgi:hypothetical protein